uniref:DX domain-containing protein n=1 Tax=Caenorhabditis japonica TaxID=281687 RepID=A0A8R1E0N8_CAEJA
MCTLSIDLKPHGIPPKNEKYCLNDEDCQGIVDEMMEKEGPWSRNTYWPRCMTDPNKNNYGSCCIANVTDLCPLGKPRLPPMECAGRTSCDENGNNYCGGRGFCCQGVKNGTGLCPDMVTVRSQQPSCSGTSYCNEGSGICVMGKCCPLLSREDDKIYLWSETPYEFPTMYCDGFTDIPDHFAFVYCDPQKQYTVRISRSDAWNQHTKATDKFCTTNRDCDSTMVCVRETLDVRRCYTYYNRSFQWSALLVPLTAFCGILVIYFGCWLNEIKTQSRVQREVLA